MFALPFSVMHRAQESLIRLGLCLRDKISQNENLQLFENLT